MKVVALFLVALLIALATMGAYQPAADITLSPGQTLRVLCAGTKLVVTYQRVDELRLYCKP